MALSSASSVECGPESFAGTHFSPRNALFDFTHNNWVFAKQWHFQRKTMFLYILYFYITCLETNNSLCYAVVSHCSRATPQCTQWFRHSWLCCWLICFTYCVSKFVIEQDMRWLILNNVAQGQRLLQYYYAAPVLKFRLKTLKRSKEILLFIIESQFWNAHSVLW